MEKCDFIEFLFEQFLLPNLYDFIFRRNDGALNLIYFADLIFDFTFNFLLCRLSVAHSNS